MDNADVVRFFDTTLRDGEQAPGIALTRAEKVEIAEQLARLGVDVVEAGFPVASQGDFEAVQAIAAAVAGPVIAGLSRTQLADVDRCWEAVRGAARARIHGFSARAFFRMSSPVSGVSWSGRSSVAGGAAAGGDGAAAALVDQLEAEFRRAESALVTLLDPGQTS